MWHFLRGYVILQIEGFSIARLLKRMSENGIRVRRVKRNGPTSVRMEIDARRFFDLRRIKKGLPVRVRILEKHGMPFVLKKLRARPVLLIGTLLIGAGLMWASGCIWMIRIEGTDRIDPDALRGELKAHGLFVGARPKGPVLITAANDLSASIRDAAWIGLDREGVTLRVQVVESLQESPKRMQTVPSDVIAQCDGVVVKLVVTHGQAKVKVGDTVKAGDVLISGTVFWQDASYETWADGTVLAAVAYETSCEAPDSITERVESGRTETLRVIRFGSQAVFAETPAFESYRVTDMRAAAVSDRLPIRLEFYTIGEIVERTRTPDERESEQLALTEAREQARALVPLDAAILNQYSVLKQQNGRTIAQAWVIAEENIGRTEERPHGGEYGESG